MLGDEVKMRLNDGTVEGRLVTLIAQTYSLYLDRYIRVNLAGKPVEVTTDLRHHHVARNERSPRVARVQRPRAGGRSRDLADLPDLSADRCL